MSRLGKPFRPPTVTLKEVRDAVPKHLFKCNPVKGALYVFRDVFFAIALFKFASCISTWTDSGYGGYVMSDWGRSLIKSFLWLAYWWFQGLVFAGIFCLGHDAGHGTLFESSVVNNTVGFLLHTFILVPYFSWRATHHAHHKATSSMEKDENYLPYTRSSYKLPSEKKAKETDYAEIFEETPIYTVYRMLIMQIFGWWIYLSQNTMGNPSYPTGTNHFNPGSPLFKPHHWNAIAISDVALAVMGTTLYSIGWNIVLPYYFVPYILVNHWIVMFTFLHHSDPTIPHYRKNAWSFLRGAAATVDRPLLGWMGRFFLHNISHDHVAHHFFVKAPFYNGPEITKAIKSVLKDNYNYDSTPSFYALYRSFTECLFVEEEGDIIFYKNKHGKAARVVANEVESSAENSQDGLLFESKL
ncbi:fatty acid desaturase-domain-containing protein [Cyathus striatus]|nr:fatty acid desaturase-domain-containing protein [Cyathus striatus]